ncbi:3-methyladenine DNA glycosylase AlkC [Sinorhizobium kostiense]|uniref:3-methyladenine DNA glycosylase AlkC n=1 Tax=Sinorhizobium kostiense TaxID=76747 RepID=A0ABS4QT07_9HYPH|nr:DNA alkylation repair protein [Sinorhizobium kostiense]MBP2233782.1 3-methyladenine DNA glycosylase AlkC [Sinorhizobium kostiense]
MPEPLKNLLHPRVVVEIADQLSLHAPGFERDRFLASAGNGLESLELMQRSLQIRDALVEALPGDFPAAAGVLQAALPNGNAPGLNGWALLPVSQFVAVRGLGDFELSLSLLRRLTPHFTGEFAVRPFIHKDQGRALATIYRWIEDDDPHVRRLASEGTRPRLPWAMRLPKLVHDPRPILAILTALLDDPEEYVRRSVANSLNDIAKDHPDLVVEFVASHIRGATRERLRLLRHASRTLLKQGHRGALANFGFDTPLRVTAQLALATPTVRFGAELVLGLTVRNTGGSPQRIMIDYAVHHRKANGSTSPKVFKWTTATLEPGATFELKKHHPMRPITTRHYYGGAHRVVIMINGEPAAEADFELAMS